MHSTRIKNYSSQSKKKKIRPISKYTYLVTPMLLYIYKVCTYIYFKITYINHTLFKSENFTRVMNNKIRMVTLYYYTIRRY